MPGAANILQRSNSRMTTEQKPGDYLVQILLPLYDNTGQPFAQAFFDEVRHELVERFGGLTAYSRAPARGLWKDGGDAVSRDDIVVYEVMVQGLDRAWWSQHRTRLAHRFAQDELLVRAMALERL